MVKKLKKRDGRIVDFDLQKIRSAIWKAAQAVGGTDEVQQAVRRPCIGGIQTVHHVMDLLDGVGEDFEFGLLCTISDVN